MNLRKLTALFLLLCFGSSCAYASPLTKKLQNTANEDSIYIYPGYIKKENNTATYTLRVYNKKSGNSNLIVQTTCSDYSSAVLLNKEYSSTYYPNYSNLPSAVYEPVKAGDMLYTPAKYACGSKDTYTKTKKNNDDDRSIGRKILGGVGTCAMFVVMAPLAIYGWIVEQNEKLEASSSK